MFGNILTGWWLSRSDLGLFFWQSFAVAFFQKAEEYVIIQILFKLSWQNGTIIVLVFHLIMFVGISVAWEA